MTSLWWDTLEPRLTAPRASLDGDTTADVVIVGAGYTGLWTAYYLLKRNPSMRVVILDANVAGFGASGRNGGWCSALFPASLEKLAKLSDRETAVRMQRTMHDTVDVVGAFVAEHGIEVDWEKGGTVIAARSAQQQARLIDSVNVWRSWGFGPEDYRYVHEGEAKDLIGASDVIGAYVTPHCAAIHPAKLVRELALIVESLGASVYEHTAATSVEPGIVRTQTGEIRAPFVVRATEGYTATLPGFKRAIAPVYSLMIATEPLEDSFWQQARLTNRATFSDGRHLIIYGQRTKDGRFAFGGRGAPYHFGSRVNPDQDVNDAVHAGLVNVLHELFPGTREAAITHRWGGPLGIARDWCASANLDRVTGMASAGGYVGDGVGTSNLAGRTLADMISGVDSELTTLPWVNHHSPKWEPEPLRWVGTNLGLRTMTSADAVEAATGKPSKRAELVNRVMGH